MKNLRTATDVVIWLMFTTSWGFMILYHWLSSTRGPIAWYADPMGRHLMSWVGVDAILSTLLVLGMVSDPIAREGWYPWLVLASLASMAGVTVWRVFILLNLYTRGEQ